MKSKEMYGLYFLPKNSWSDELMWCWKSKPTTKDLMDYFVVDDTDHESINAINELLNKHHGYIGVNRYLLGAMDECTFKE
jgi:hypothetical protein